MPDYRNVFDHPNQLAQSIHQQEAAHALICALGPVVAQLGHGFTGDMTLQRVDGSSTLTFTIQLKEETSNG